MGLIVHPRHTQDSTLYQYVTIWPQGTRGPKAIKYAPTNGRELPSSSSGSRVPQGPSHIKVTTPSRRNHPQRRAKRPYSKLFKSYLNNYYNHNYLPLWRLQHTNQHHCITLQIVEYKLE